VCPGCGDGGYFICVWLQAAFAGSFVGVYSGMTTWLRICRRKDQRRDVDDVECANFDREQDSIEVLWRYQRALSAQLKFLTAPVVSLMCAYYLQAMPLFKRLTCAGLFICVGSADALLGPSTMPICKHRSSQG
jgi:hypothetical protein